MIQFPPCGRGKKSDIVNSLKMLGFSAVQLSRAGHRWVAPGAHENPPAPAVKGHASTVQSSSARRPKSADRIGVSEGEVA
jgi:hypothetical protein